jgi:hypothetical protein
MFYSLFLEIETTAQFIQKFPQSIIFFVRFCFHMVFTQTTPLSQAQKRFAQCTNQKQKIRRKRLLAFLYINQELIAPF